MAGLLLLAVKNSARGEEAVGARNATEFRSFTEIISAGNCES